jgi:hypothetical protein
VSDVKPAHLSSASSPPLPPPPPPLVYADGEVSRFASSAVHAGGDTGLVVEAPRRPGLLALRATAATEAQRQQTMVERAALSTVPSATMARTPSALLFAVPSGDSQARPAWPPFAGTAQQAAAPSAPPPPAAEPAGRVSTREAIEAVRRAGGYAATPARKAAAMAESPLARAFKRASELAAEPPRPKVRMIDLTDEPADVPITPVAAAAPVVPSPAPATQEGGLGVEAARAYLAQAGFPCGIFFSLGSVC